MRAGVLGLVTLASFLVASGLPAAELRSERIEWRELHYKASKLFVTAEARVSLREDGENVQLFLGSEALGRISETRIWLRPATAEALREEKLKIHRDAGLRAYFYEKDHALKVRYHERPVEQARQPLETWKVKGRERQNFGASPPVVTSPSGLLYWLGASGLEKKGDVLEGTIFADERLVVARAEVVAVEAFDDEIENLDGGGAYRPRVAIRILLTGREPGSGEPIDLDLLGLEGDLEVLLDRDRRLPLALRGSMSVLGRVNVELQAARFR